MTTKYNNLIDCFSKGEKFRLEKMLGLCRSISECVQGKELYQNGRSVTKCCVPVCPHDIFGIKASINAHQRRIPKSVLSRFLGIMSSLSWPSTFKDFEDLYDYVSKKSGLSFPNCLLVYDFSLRMGYNISPKVLPQKYVYLFNGAKEGAEALLGAKIKGYKIPTSIFHYIIGKRLNSYELEHFFCVCKSHIDMIGPVNKLEVTNAINCYLSSSACTSWNIHNLRFTK